MMAMLLYDTLVFIAVAMAIYKNRAVHTTDLSCLRRFGLLVCGNGLYKVSEMLLKSGQLYYGWAFFMIPRILSTDTGSCSVTIGVQLLSAISAFLGLKYSQLFYMIFVPLSSAMACKVFRMVLLCDTTVGPLKTAEIHEMLHWEHQETERTLGSLAEHVSVA